MSIHVLVLVDLNDKVVVFVCGLSRRPCKMDSNIPDYSQNEW